MYANNSNRIYRAHGLDRFGGENHECTSLKFDNLWTQFYEINCSLMYEIKDS